MNDLFGEDYYIDQVRQGKYHPRQFAMLRNKAKQQRWHKLKAELDAECYGKKDCGVESGKGHPINREVVELGRYTVSESLYDKLKNKLGREPVDEDLLQEGRSLYHRVEAASVGSEIKLLSTARGVGFKSRRYGKSINLHLRPDGTVIMHNWTLKGFTSEVEAEWRCESVDGEVKTDNRAPGGTCFASVRLPDLEVAFKLLHH